MLWSPGQQSLASLWSWPDTLLRLGVRVNINHLTGAITGSVLQLFKEDKEVSPELLEHGAEAVDVVLLNHVVCFRQTSA